MARTTKLPERSFFSSRELDNLARMNTELLSELWSLRDRVLVLEHLLVAAAVLKNDQVDLHQPDAILAAKLKAERERLIARVVDAGQRQSNDR